MQNKEEQLLKLRAQDKEDLQILSSCMQDAIVPASAMQFDQELGQFKLLATRFCWERQPARKRRKSYFQRVKTGLYFNHVKTVKYRGFQKTDVAQLLVLLSIDQVDDQRILLHFAGGAEILLNIESLRCFMLDVPKFFWTYRKPEHEPQAA